MFSYQQICYFDYFKYLGLPANQVLKMKSAIMETEKTKTPEKTINKIEWVDGMATQLIKRIVKCTGSYKDT